VRWVADVPGDGGRGLDVDLREVRFHRRLRGIDAEGAALGFAADRAIRLADRLVEGEPLRFGLGVGDAGMLLEHRGLELAEDRSEVRVAARTPVLTAVTDRAELGYELGPFAVEDRRGAENALGRKDEELGPAFGVEAHRYRSQVRPTRLGVDGDLENVVAGRHSGRVDEAARERRGVDVGAARMNPLVAAGERVESVATAASRPLDVHQAEALLVPRRRHLAVLGEQPVLGETLEVDVAVRAGELEGAPEGPARGRAGVAPVAAAGRVVEAVHVGARRRGIGRAAAHRPEAQVGRAEIGRLDVEAHQGPTGASAGTAFVHLGLLNGCIGDDAHRSPQALCVDAQVRSIGVEDPL
jgi:hypothetical protein